MHRLRIQRLIAIIGTVLAAALLTSCGQTAQPVGAAGQADAAHGADADGAMTTIAFDQFFTPSNDGTGQVTEFMQSLNGKKVGIVGYMTELTPIDNRFVYLVPTAGAICPFCSADNPLYMEAIAVYLPEHQKDLQYTQEALWAYGTLEVGEQVDEATGLISMFRLNADSVEVYQAR
ncbi:hypothetical protein [Paenibacillus sp.]|uniref:hypothetical protein n=1 Tax=Paenibacillus sp. TaxID=58172 RepID=UPI002D2BA160|nr:hypothetical protein [Paenibacillus sp.]HZG88318.1 hypothetical protein [Paenibacillus sp.]